MIRYSLHLYPHIPVFDPAQPAEELADPEGQQQGQQYLDRQYLQQYDPYTLCGHHVERADLPYQAGGAHTGGGGGVFHRKERRAQHAQQSRAQRWRQPDKGLGHDVAKLHHARTQTLYDEAGQAVFAPAGDGKAQHLAAAACGRRTGGEEEPLGHRHIACAEDHRSQSRAGYGRGQCKSEQRGDDKPHGDGHQQGRAGKIVLQGTDTGIDGRRQQIDDQTCGKERADGHKQNVKAGLAADKIANLQGDDRAEICPQRAGQLIADGAGNRRAVEGKGAGLELVRDGSADGRADDRAAGRQHGGDAAQYIPVQQLVDLGEDEPYDEGGEYAQSHGGQGIHHIFLKGLAQVKAFEKG